MSIRTSFCDELIPPSHRVTCPLHWRPYRATPRTTTPQHVSPPAPPQRNLNSQRRWPTFQLSRIARKKPPIRTLRPLNANSSTVRPRHATRTPIPHQANPLQQTPNTSPAMSTATFNGSATLIPTISTHTRSLMLDFKSSVLCVGPMLRSRMGSSQVLATKR